MIVYLANKTQFHDDIDSNWIEEIVNDSFMRQLGKPVDASEELEIPKAPQAYPFPILSPEEAADCPNAVPIFDIKFAALDFSKELPLQDCEYGKLPDHFNAKPELFLAQIVAHFETRTTATNHLEQILSFSA